VRRGIRATSSDQLVIVAPARVVLHANRRPEAGRSVTCGAVDHRRQAHELLELRDAGSVDGGLFENRQKIVVLRRCAERARLKEARMNNVLRNYN
jgi:hypothetical protein